MRDLKASTSKNFNETSGLIHKIGWQDGYGAFTVGKSQEETVRRYIANQEQHHAKETFQVEYVRMLELSGADYDPRYLWDCILSPLSGLKDFGWPGPVVITTGRSSVAPIGAGRFVGTIVRKS